MDELQALRRAVDELGQWMQMRRDQGGGAAMDLRRLRRQVQRATRQCQRERPSADVLAHEPNDLAGILRLRPPGPRRLWERLDTRLYSDKLKGAFLARAAGCTLGAIVEGSSVEHMENLALHSGMAFPPRDYWTYTPFPWGTRYGMSRNSDYLRGQMTHLPVDDDLTYTLLGLLILEDYGPTFTTADVGKAWLAYLPMACTAEAVAMENLRKGMSWRRCGEVGNPYAEWIGADIRSDAWGYVAPGRPEKAAELAWRDAYISHRRGGIYGAMYFAAAIAAAFAVDDPLEACRIALTEIPRRSRLSLALRWALEQAPRIKDYRHARRLVDKKFPGMSPVHTVNNAACTIFGLALGGTDVTAVLGNTVAIGLDNDCTAATAGSIVGAVVGAKGIAGHWYKPFRNRVRTYMTGKEWFTIPDILRRFARAAKAV
ncbi:MAG: ADP-ribosylglycohydrolase family protein [Planctomycetaceae bacterium]|nr:ADP-ribosylglycohydrolase family protein [Planctomycetaceae bacterium]